MMKVADLYVKLVQVPDQPDKVITSILIGHDTAGLSYFVVANRAKKKTKVRGKVQQDHQQPDYFLYRAERRAGELIPEQFPHGGDRKSTSYDPSLKDVGISEHK